MALKQTLSFKLQQKLSPQQIQLMKLLQLPTVALEQRIKEEMESNPALDEGKEEEDDEFNNDLSDEYDDDDRSEAEKEFNFDDYIDDSDTPSYKLTANNHSKDDEEKHIPLSVGATFQEMLESQIVLFNLDDDDHEIALHIIGSLDDAGYLRREISAIVDDLAFTQNIITDEKHIEKIVQLIQHLDPAGVGARTLQECLLIQLKRKKNHSLITKNAQEIIEHFFEEFSKKHYAKIIERLQISEEDLRLVIDEILKLNPKPGNSSTDNSKTVQHIVPDFLLTVEDGKIDITLNGRNAPDLKVSRSYIEMIEGYKAQKDKPSKSQKDALMFVKQKLDSAKWFIDAIKQRQHTLILTVNAIVERQKNYFLDGDETQIVPMILKDIAEEIEMDISTVSRVVNSKYIQTPFGTFLLKTFFSESLSTDSGEEVSSREVKKILQNAIEDESKKKPLTDEKLSKLLNDKGYNIARRTIAKYREQLNIPVARLRKEI
ncbi:MAG: RNA polymerase sigma-54 factor [Flavobacteriales bacterium CG18_big_fil_WC_8_21_14_2_50_32_9]|nr:MAG: RNA polymerase sigma-54 factor [Flavobacteriales bacterium CG18_big_fil_WC_8_21_14_2_50_32_9]PJC62787.1 MAG: RNA polymerase sigma-54 factor [Flavobacteriales bacterium CG_4_9_14_0_2_um_filter_32_27]